MNDDMGAETAGIAENAEQPTEPTESVDALKAALKSERDARKKYEREYKQATSRLTEFENANKSDLERLISERDTLKELAAKQQAQIRAAALDATVREAAESAGARNVKAVMRLIRDELLIDEDSGEVANLAEAIAAVRLEVPEMFGAGGGRSDAGRTGTPPSTVTMSDLIRQRAGF